MSARTIAPGTATGLPPGVRSGPLGARLLAQLVDAVVPAALLAHAWTADLTPVGIALVVVLLVAWLVLVWSTVASSAASPGMRLMKLQLVGLRDGRPIGWRRFGARQVVLAGLAATVVGLVAMLVLLARHPRKQGWHDLLVDSVMIKQRALAPRLPRRPEPERTDQPAVTPARPVEEAGQFSPAPKAPQAEPVGAESARAPQGSTRLATPGYPDAGSEAPPEADWLAVLDDGRPLGISGLVLVGRRPQARPGEEDAELVTVSDESRTVSKTHLALGVNADGLFVTDRGSTNGSTLTTPGGTSSPCSPGDVVSVPEGGIVSFGSHWLRAERRRKQ